MPSNAILTSRRCAFCLPSSAMDAVRCIASFCLQRADAPMGEPSLIEPPALRHASSETAARFPRPLATQNGIRLYFPVSMAVAPGPVSTTRSKWPSEARRNLKVLSKEPDGGRPPACWQDLTDPFRQPWADSKALPLRQRDEPSLVDHRS